MKKLIISLLLIVSVFCNYGCIELLAAGALTGAGEYLKYTMNNIAHKTFTCGQKQVKTAAMDALRRMGIEIKKIAIDDKNTKIYASTKEINIKIELNSLTVNTTKVSVNASKNRLMKDKSTAREIIAQMNSILSEENPVDFQKVTYIKTLSF